MEETSDNKTFTYDFFLFTNCKWKSLELIIFIAWNAGEAGDINTVLCPIKVNSNSIELTLHMSFYFV